MIGSNTFWWIAKTIRSSRSTSSDIKKEIEAFRRSYTRGRYNQLVKVDNNKTQSIVKHPYQTDVQLIGKIKTEIKRLMNAVHNPGLQYSDSKEKSKCGFQ